MKKKQAFIERIEPSFGSSFALKKYESRADDQKPFWHFHQEVEIVFIKEGNGKRHIGNHISNYYNGDLIVIGSGLPHNGFADRLIGAGTEVVLQFREDFLGPDILKRPEFIAVRRFLDLAKNGVSFFGNTRSEVGERLESLFYMSNFEKLLEVMKILNILATSRDLEILNVSGVTLVHSVQGADRLDEVFSFVRENFQDDIALEQLADITSMTVPSFCRFFKKQTG
ncbi:MAG: AraC family transcriptional regulator, partial [Saprospiraceae bacterium]|nr:AraC family transcriptional regulator [Saprospiraceae bacterium]